MTYRYEYPPVRPKSDETLVRNATFLNWLYQRRADEYKDREPQANMFEEYLTDIFDEAYHLLVRKHHDYGPKNIADAPGGPLNGLLVRMHDKHARLVNLVHGDKTPKVDESIEETLMDLANYALIGIMVQRGHWPGVER